jgi:hypothetical protein
VPAGANTVGWWAFPPEALVYSRNMGNILRDGRDKSFDLVVMNSSHGIPFLPLSISNFVVEGSNFEESIAGILDQKVLV